ncbi:FAD binding domain-containing protein [Lutibaculum baratangense]|uniref:Carbon monoxide dehydrogenase medium chain n=1 Tax=Lutibaculum baratangense AMV1 TaxID=631454 RepID=V4TJS6_9HYPH|nr:xanthine dehydrogenase family protein subunit M [Lutibaculum baratangense]ESR26158.1 Carbon monoxide dehydrogenase medium chain [Lutibaculum baratangense AMV1]
MYELRYRRPADLAEAASLFEAAEDPAYISGGHTLLPTLKGRLAAPDALIDLRRLPELKGIRREGDRLVVGAGEVHRDVAASPDVREALPALAGLAGSIGDVHVRNHGTIGGSVANNDPAADYPAAVLGLGAVVRTNRREIAADDYFQGLFTTALEEGEIVVALSFPTGAECGYAKFRNPASRYAMAAVFVARFADAVRVAVTGAGNDGVFRWTAAEKALATSFSPEALADLSVAEADMIDDLHGSAEYRRHLVSVIAERAVANMGRAVVTP